MKALIIYDDVALAVKAIATLQRSARRAEVTVRWNIKPWRLDILRLPSTAEEALGEAVDAELIVFAGPQVYSLPSWLEQWLECWLTHRHAGEAALAVIGNGRGGKPSSHEASELWRFAALHGLGFIMGSQQ